MKRSYVPVLAAAPLLVLVLPLLLRWSAYRDGRSGHFFPSILLNALVVGFVVMLAVQLALYLPANLCARGVTVLLGVYGIALAVLAALCVFALAFPQVFSFVGKVVDASLYLPWLLGADFFFAAMYTYARQELAYGPAGPPSRPAGKTPKAGGTWPPVNRNRKH